MTYSKKDLNHLFERWGKKSTVSPDQNESLKMKILSKTPEQKTSTSKKMFAFYYGWLAVVGFAVLLLVVVNKEQIFDEKISSHSSGSSASYDARQNGGVALPAERLNPTDLGIDEPKAASLPAEESYSILDRLTKLVTEPGYSPLPYPNSINDKREFLKTSYGAQIKTRDVKKLSTRIITMIRGYGGRIDNSSVYSEYGTINFVLPKKSLAAFSGEISSLVPSRFLEENQSDTNLLPEKQGIEANQQTSQKSLDELKKQRLEETKKHSSAVGGIRRNVSDLSSQIAKIDSELSALEVGSSKYNELLMIRKDLSNQRTNSNYRLEVENNRYNNEISNIDLQVKNIENYLVDLGKQDQNLLDNVETINGSIYLEHVSVYGVVKLYVPANILWPGIIVIVCTLYYLRRRKIANLPL